MKSNNRETTRPEKKDAENHHFHYQTSRRPGASEASGYAVDDEENSLGARCLGAPIFDALGNVTAALGASGTLTQTDESRYAADHRRAEGNRSRISRQLQKSGTTGTA